MIASEPEDRAAGPPPPPGRRHAARLLAVQALYQLAQTESDPEAVVAEFVGHRLKSGEVDRELFVFLVRGAAHERERLDLLIGSALAEGWTTARLAVVLLAILRAGAFELGARADVAPRVTISEYVDVAHAFLDRKEAALVNAVLDRLARQLRPEEMAAPARRADA